MNKFTWDSIPSDALLMNVIDSSIDCKYSWHRQYVLRDKVFHDKELIAMGAKVKRDFNYLDGESCDRLVKEAIAAGDEIKPMLKKLLVFLKILD